MSAPRPWSRSRVALLVIGLFLATTTAPLVSGALPLPRRVDRRAVQMVVGVSALSLGVPAIFAVLWLDVRRRKRFIAFALAAAGLATESYMLRGVQGRGGFAGRSARAFWLPAQRYAPTSLELAIDSRAAARLVASPSAGGGWLNMPKVQLGDLGFGHLSLSADDPTWARGVLADPAARSAILALTVPAAGEARWVCIEPGAVLLRTAGILAHDITPQLVGPAFAALESLAAAAERAPWPASPTQPSSLDAMFERRRNLALVIVLVTVALVLALGVAGAVVALLLDASSR